MGVGRGGSACRGKYLIKQRHVVGGRFRRHFLHMQRRLCCLLHLLPPRLFFCDCGFWFSFVCLASRLPPLLASSCQCWQTMRRAATLKVSFGAQRVASRRVANMQIAWICFCCCHVFIFVFSATTTTTHPFVPFLCFFPPLCPTTTLCSFGGFSVACKRVWEFAIFQWKALTKTLMHYVATYWDNVT